ncbi:hypothetical protein [Compostimonas suwonensis]|uniref:hypothetical protein n=1 Tax=Compostimonas suwonensis TaxID=1048394 RepID=UPI000C2311C3|nr:hypothetical protein [Compostimonas suwonensis]
MTQHPSRTIRPEHRVPALIAVVAALLLYSFLPFDLLSVQRYVVVVTCALLLVPLIVVNPRRFNRESRWSRRASLGLTFLLLAANQLTLVQLIVLLVSGVHEGPTLLLAALEVWLTNVIAFALVYWDIDRGGAIKRAMSPRDELPPADFRFPQDEDHDAVTEVAKRSSIGSDWVPQFVDYFYFSLSNSMAFSPTDTMPLSHRAKLLMGLESFAGFIILALVIARAVSLIG